jgi:hypothetical protein
VFPFKPIGKKKPRFVERKLTDLFPWREKTLAAQVSYSTRDD